MATKKSKKMSKEEQIELFLKEKTKTPYEMSKTRCITIEVDRGTSYTILFDNEESDCQQVYRETIKCDELNLPLFDTREVKAVDGQMYYWPHKDNKTDCHIYLCQAEDSDIKKDKDVPNPDDWKKITYDDKDLFLTGWKL